MKLNHQKTRWLQLIFPSLLLTSVFLLGGSITFLETAEANSLPPVRKEIAQRPSRANNLPDAVAQAVLKDAASRSNAPSNKLRIIKAEAQEWPDGCLGLAEPDTFCTQVVTPGWRVFVLAGKGNYIYRTNDSGSVVKLERSNPRASVQ